MEFLTGIGNWFGFALQALMGGSNMAPLILIFAAVFCATLAAGALALRSKTIRERIAGPDDRSAKNKRKVSLRLTEPNTRLHQVLKGLEKHVVPMNEEERSGLRLRMIRAGYMGESAVRVFYFVRIGLAVFLPVAFLLMAPTIAPEMTFGNLMAISMTCFAAGLYLPVRWVGSRTENRQRAITIGLPDALDMMVVCVEAGLGLDAAIVRVGDQLDRPHPVLAEHLRLVALELRAGSSREEALQNFAMRSDVQDVRTLVVLIIQSDALGADLTQTLKIQAEEMRSNRMLRAEETAHKLPVKLTIPLVLFILPAMFVVVIGPGMINIIRNLMPALGG